MRILLVLCAIVLVTAVVALPSARARNLRKHKKKHRAHHYKKGAPSPAVACPSLPAAAPPAGLLRLGGWEMVNDTGLAASLLAESWDQAVAMCAFNATDTDAFNSSELTVCDFQQQVVAGLNYEITFIYASEYGVYTAELFQPLPGTDDAELQFQNCSQTL